MSSSIQSKGSDHQTHHPYQLPHQTIRQSCCAMFCASLFRCCVLTAWERGGRPEGLSVHRVLGFCSPFFFLFLVRSCIGCACLLPISLKQRRGSTAVHVSLLPLFRFAGPFPMFLEFQSCSSWRWRTNFPRGSLCRTSTWSAMVMSIWSWPRFDAAACQREISSEGPASFGIWSLVPGAKLRLISL